MANIKAAASGNWSNPATWSGGVLPTFTDSADSFGFTVTIDQNINLGESGSLIGTVAGAGGFSATVARTIVANIVATARTVLTLSHTTGVVDVTGDVNGGTAVSAVGIANTAAGGLTVNGNVTGGINSTTQGVNNASTGAVIVNGNVTGGSVSAAHGIILAAAGAALTVTGNVVGGSGISVTGINNAAASTVIVDGNVTGGSSTAAHGINNISTGTVTVSGFAKGGDGSSGSGVSNSVGGVATVGRAIGNNFGPGGGTQQGFGVVSASSLSTSRTYAYALEYGQFGMSPVSGHVRVLPDPQNSVTVTTDALTLLILAETLPQTYPTADDVRQGISYMGGTRTGQLAVPVPASVAYGVATDNTTGTALLTVAAAMALWDAVRADYDTPGTFGAVDEWASAGGGGATPPTVIEIRTELDVNSTRLANLDAAISSRNAVAPDNAGVAAIKAKTDLIPPDPADTIDIPTAGDNALAVWASAERSLTTFGSLVADIWASITRTLTSGGGGGGSGGSTAEDIWSYSQRTLTQTAAEVAATLGDSGTLTITRAVTFAVAITAMNIPATWTRIYFTAKMHPGGADSGALVQIVESNPGAGADGLLVLNRAPANVAAWATLIVNQAAGTVDIEIMDEATAQLMQSNGSRYDIKALLSDGTSVLLAAGALTVNTTPTEALV